jgi:hypothetical protein
MSVALAGLVAALALAAPAPPAPLTVGAYYYPWYESAQWARGTMRMPALGGYDSRDPKTIAAHYGWAQRYGVDVFLTSWLGPGSAGDVTVRDHLLPSPARGRTRIAILYESILRLGLTDNRIVFGERERDILLHDFDYLAETYFRHPAYYRIRGRPVVVLYVSRIFRGAYAEAISALREHVRATWGIELYLIGDEVDWDLGPSRARIRLYDAITGYILYSRTQPQTGFLRLVEARYRAFRRVAAERRVAFVPGALPRYDDRGFRPEEGHYVLSEPRLFERGLSLASRYVDPRLGLMTVTSWNEWHEDTQIEPATDYGLEPLEKLARFKRAFLARR